LNPQYMPILAMAGVVLVTIVFAAICISRYARVGPNRAMITGTGPPLPLPLSSETEERGMKYGGGRPGVALADSLTPGYFLKPLRGFWES